MIIIPPNIFNPNSIPRNIEDNASMIKEMMAGINTLIGDPDFNFWIGDIALCLILVILYTS